MKQALALPLPRRSLRVGIRLAIATLLIASLLLAGCSGLPENVTRPASHALDAPGSTPLGQLAARKRPAGSAQATSGFALLASANDAFAARLALAQGASQTLDLQYYLIHADPSAERLLDAVRDAAERGVRVRILLDDLHATGGDALVAAFADIPGIQMRLFNPLPGRRVVGVLRTLRSLPDFDRIQRRMHNKLFIADNAWGITGGRNLGDAYFGAASSSDYVDLDVLAAGPAVRAMSEGFDRYWNDALAYPAHALISTAELEQLRDFTQSQNAGLTVEPAHALPSALDLSRLRLQWAPAQVLTDNPRKLAPQADGTAAARGADAVMQGVLSLLNAAQHDVLIVTPYFVPDPSLMTAFADLKMRGIDVRILTNSLSSTTSLLAQVGYARHRKELLQLGLDVHEMRSETRAKLRHTLLGSGVGDSQASLHAKLLVVDGRTSMIGSMNLDFRSKLQNTEVALVIDNVPLSREAAQQVQALIQAAAWNLELMPDNSLRWRAPPGADFLDASHEPDTSVWLRLLATTLMPLVPEELL